MQDFFEPSSSRWHLWWILDTIRFSNASVQQRFFFQKANLSWHLFLDLTGAKRKGRFVDSVCVCVFFLPIFSSCAVRFYMFLLLTPSYQMLLGESTSMVVVDRPRPKGSRHRSVHLELQRPYGGNGNESVCIIVSWTSQKSALFTQAFAPFPK